ncbi:MAG: helix-turn-helix domain-containing protein [Lactobacillus amylovorus]|jgi:cytoskeletal protein RodZ
MADIGDKLKSAREAKGLSIQDIEKATKIQSRYLEAIENNEFDKLPGDFYVRAFIRQYAQVVGLDGKELLSDYHEDIPESKPDEYVENSIDNKSEEVRETNDNKKNLWKNYLPRIAIGLGVIIVILVVYVLYARLSSGGQQNEADNSGVTVSSQKSSSSSSKKPAKKVAVSQVRVKKISDNEYRVTGLKNNRRLVVRAGSTQNISASVSIDGNTTWQSTLIAKQKHTVALPSNVQRVVITLGNDNGTSITIGGKKIPYAPNNAYRTITQNDSNNTNDNNSTNNGGSNTQSSQTQSSKTTTSRTKTQSSRTQSSTTQSSQANEQSRQTQQSSAAQSSTTTQGNAGGNNGNNGN